MFTEYIPLCTNSVYVSTVAQKPNIYCTVGTGLGKDWFLCGDSDYFGDSVVLFRNVNYFYNRFQPHAVATFQWTVTQYFL